MRKKLVRTSLILVIASMLLTGCSAVFDAAISGTVKDSSAASNTTGSTSSTTGGVADVMVYAYSNESDWNNAYNSWNPGQIFDDRSVPSAKTASDGSFSISTLRWKTNNPQYGKDADRTSVYLLLFKKEYGLSKVDSRIVQSDKSNNFGIVYITKIMKSKTVTINFKDKDDTSANAGNISSTSGFAYRYSYNDGYGTVSEYVDNINAGTDVLSISYKDTAPVLRISEITTGSDYRYEGGDLSLDLSSDTRDYINISCENAWEQKILTVYLKDGGMSDYPAVTTPMEFMYSYDDGDGKTISETLNTSSGSQSFTVKYRKGSSPVVTLSSFTNHGNTEYYLWTESKTSGKCMASDSVITVNDSSDSIKFNSNKKNYSLDVYFKRNIGTFPGLGGYAISSAVSTAKGTPADDSKVINLYDKDNNIVGTAITKIDTSNVPSNTTVPADHGRFSGLGNGIEISFIYSGDSYKSEPVKFTLKEDGTDYGSISITNATKASQLDNLLFNSTDVKEYSL